MFHNEVCISSSGKLHGWYELKPKLQPALIVWIEEFTAFEAVTDLLPLHHFSEVAIYRWKPKPLTLVQEWQAFMRAAEYGYAWKAVGQ